MTSTVGSTHRFGSLMVLVALLVGCGGGDDEPAAGSTAVPTAVDDDAGEPDATDPLFVRTSDDVAPDTGTDIDTGTETGTGTGTGDADSDARDAPVAASPESTTTTVTTTIPLVSDTGVPGIDSDDQFCRSWSRFAGSFRAIGLVSAIRDADAGLRLEVLASGAVVDAIAGMGEHLPAALEPERDVLLIDFAGPFGRRADKALASLVAAGVSDDDIDQLTDAWLTTLADVGLDDPSLDLELPDGVDVATVDAGIVDFVSSTPAIRDDPSLTTLTEIPLTDDYTFVNCPDAGTLAGNDDL